MLKLNLVVILTILSSLAFADDFKLTPYKQSVQINAQFDESDAFRTELLNTGDLYLLDTASSPGALLVIEKDYLTVSERDWVAGEIAEGLEKVPQIVGRGFLTKDRITFYIYQNSPDRPFSFTAPIGSSLGRWGTMLLFVKQKKTPIFHELAHLTERVKGKDRGAISLQEGLADFVQQTVRPLEGFAFTPSDIDPDELAKKTFEIYTDPRLYDAVGSDQVNPPTEIANVPGSFPARWAFYFVSHSFVKYLVNQYGMAKTLAILDAEGKEAAYLSIFGKTLAEIKKDWYTKLVN